MLEKFKELEQNKRDLEEQQKILEKEFSEKYLTGKHWKDVILDYVWPQSCHGLSKDDIYERLTNKIQDLVFNETEVTFKIGLQKEYIGDPGLWIVVNWVPLSKLTSPTYDPETKNILDSINRKTERIKRWMEEIEDIKKEIKTLQNYIDEEQAEVDALTSWIKPK